MEPCDHVDLTPPYSTGDSGWNPTPLLILHHPPTQPLHSVSTLHHSQEQEV